VTSSRTLSWEEITAFTTDKNYPFFQGSSCSKPDLEVDRPTCFLLQYGFVVATVTSLGDDNAHPEQNTSNGRWTDARDLEFAWSLLRFEPNVASNSFGTFGHRLGGVIALMLAMQNSDVAAAAGLDGSYGFSDQKAMLTSSYRYSPANMHAALLDTHRMCGCAVPIKIGLAPARANT
jgi:pimeloyl-ACP methyl ester carboxylesterase